MLEVLSKKTGIAVSWNCNVKSLIQEDRLQLLWDSKQMPSTDVFLFVSAIRHTEWHRYLRLGDRVCNLHGNGSDGCVQNKWDQEGD
jgi:hypothetical protein